MQTDSLTVSPDRWTAPAWTRLVGGPLGAGMTATLFFLALLWRDPMLCWNDDYAISILPVLRDVARSWSEGHWPLLSPSCWACGNLAGEYQYGTFSVFVNAVVVLFWKFHWSYPATAAAISGAHVFVMAAGRRATRARPGLECFPGGDGRADYSAQRLDGVLGRDELVRRAGGASVAALGVVGIGGIPACNGFLAALAVARALYLPVGHGRFSVHGHHVGGGHCRVGDTCLGHGATSARSVAARGGLGVGPGAGGPGVADVA